MNRDTTELIARTTRALGPPCATPELVAAGGGRLERARYRVFRWGCPVCRAGYDDPIWRPFVVDSDGRVIAECCHAPARRIAAALRRELDLAILLEEIESGITP